MLLRLKMPLQHEKNAAAGEKCCGRKRCGGKNGTLKKYAAAAAAAAGDKIQQYTTVI